MGADRSPAEPAARRRSVRLGPALVVLLLAAHAGLSLFAITRQGMAFDEDAHLPGGLAALTTGDYRLSDTSWLPGRWAAIPLALGGVEPPLSSSGGWARAEVFHFGFDLFGTDLGPARRMLVAGRSMILLLSLGGALLVFFIARSLHGERGALLALAMYCLSPTILAHSGLVTDDLAAALALLAGTWTTWLLLERVSPLRLAAGCTAVGLALLVKASTLALLPVAAALTVLRLARKAPWPVGREGAERLVRGPARVGVALALLGAHALVGWLAVWAFWGFRAEASPDPGAQRVLAQRWETAVASSGGPGRLLEAVSDAGLLPEAWLQAVAHVSEHARRPAYLLGRVSVDGFTSFMPQVFLRKTTLGAFGLLLLALVAGRSRHATPLWILIGLYFASAMLTKLSIGHRHLLPVYPALFVIAGGAAAWLDDRRLGRRALAPVLLVLMAAETLLAAPGYLSYFNPIGGGRPEAWRRVVDSSLDWGQDLPALARWLSARVADRPLYLSYFGTDDPLSHGIEANELQSYHPWTYRHGRARGFVLGEGLYVMSATMYQGLHAEPRPPWTPESERRYRALRAVVDPAFDPATPPELAQRLTADPDWRDRYLELHELRFVRLRDWLHLHRPEPDSRPTPCFLAWSLSAQDLEQALRGPAPFVAPR